MINMVENAANIITNITCKECGQENRFSVGRKLYGGSDDKIFLECICGMHCSIRISTSIELIQDWWK
jgi:RNase P subunit RPR2